MARTKGIVEHLPRQPGAGARSNVSWADRYREDPRGTVDIIIRGLPLSSMEHAELMAAENGMRSAQEYIRSLIAKDLARRLIV